MENKVSISAEDLKRELDKKIRIWAERSFNFIQVAVLEKYCDNNLTEYIRNPSLEEAFDKWIIEYSDNVSEERIINFLKESDYYWETDDSEFNIDLKMEDYRKQFGSIKESFILVFGEDKWEEFKEWFCEEYEDDIYDWINKQENYPMCNTCYEFRDSFYNQEEDVQKCMSVGLGVIEGLDDFNNLVFMASVGHSFYSAYWIPLYLKFFPTEAEKFAEINYSDL